MLEAVAKSPAMLVYLDNFINFAAEIDGEPVGSNENFARECIELHCLGADESPTATLPREQVPGYPNPIGYCQEDVVDVARALTGWTFAIDWIEWPCAEGADNDGHFFYCQQPARHAAEDDPRHADPGRPDRRPGRRRGLRPPGLASRPAGRFVARKLCRRLIGDFPPQSIIDSAAALFTAQWQAPDQIRQVVRHIVLSNEFRTTWGEKVKRPFEIAAAALRAGGADFPFTLFPPTRTTSTPSTGSTKPAASRSSAGTRRTATPTSAAPGRAPIRASRSGGWSPGSSTSDDDDDDRFLDIVGATLASPARSANEIVDFWIPRIFGRELSAADRDELVDFMAAGHNPDVRPARSKQQRLAGLHPGPAALPRRPDVHVARIPAGADAAPSHRRYVHVPVHSPRLPGRLLDRHRQPRRLALQLARLRAGRAGGTTTRSSSCSSCAAARTG